ncbi:hypothetical protein BDR04DRAFT_1015502, partial [Suillus decipiens]
QKHHVFEQLLDSYPGLLDHLRDGSEEEKIHMGKLISKDATGATGDDIKMLKAVVLDWIALNGEAIQPPLHRNTKINHGFNHKLTRSHLCPAWLDWKNPQTREHLPSGEMLVSGDQWLIFLYANQFMILKTHGAVFLGAAC